MAVTFCARFATAGGARATVSDLVERGVKEDDVYIRVITPEADPRATSHKHPSMLYGIVFATLVSTMTGAMIGPIVTLLTGYVEAIMVAPVVGALCGAVVGAVSGEMTKAEIRGEIKPFAVVIASVTESLVPIAREIVGRLGGNEIDASMLASGRVADMEPSINYAARRAA